MALCFSQKEIEQKVAEILKHGDIKDISNISGIGYSYIDQMLNPNDERKSYIVGALEIICALDEIDELRGEKLFLLITKIRKLSKKRKTSQECLTSSTADLNKEIGDVVNAHLEGKCYYDQLAEVIEAKAALDRQERNIISKINEEKETPNAKRLRLAK